MIRGQFALDTNRGSCRMEIHVWMDTRVSGRARLSRSTLRGKPLPALFKPCHRRRRDSFQPTSSHAEFFIFSSPDNNPPVVTWTKRGRGRRNLLLPICTSSERDVCARVRPRRSVNIVIIVIVARRGAPFFLVCWLALAFLIPSFDLTEGTCRAT